MTETPRSPARRMRTTLGKALFGVAVFATTVSAYALVERNVRMRLPLPDAGGRQGACTVWLIGSSSVYRWRSARADMAPWFIHNRGIGGALLPELRARFANETGATPPQAILFYAGENDIAAGASGAQAAADLLALLDMEAARMPRVPMMVVGLKPSPARWALRPEQLRFNAIVADRARQGRGVGYLAVADALLVRGRPGPFYTDDGIHINAAGYAIWGKRVRAAFDRAMPADVVRRCTGARGGVA